MPVVEQVNARFRWGAPSNDPNEAGLIVHQFDGQEAHPKRWLPCPSTKTWCAKFRDRFAASLINAQLPYVFNDAGGLIFRMFPSSANRIFCSFGGDGGTMTNMCRPPGETATCLPGCWRDKPNWCTPTKTYQCAFKPGDLGMMQHSHLTQRDPAHYNEVILSTEHYVRHLPRSLEAMFVQDLQSSDYHDTRRAHSLLLEEYGLTAQDIPLLLFNQHNLHTPFTEVSRSH